MKKFILTLVCACIAGCVSHSEAPGVSNEFIKMESLSEIDGTYTNLGVMESAIKTTTIDFILTRKESRDANIDAVEFKSVDEQRLDVTCLRNGKGVRQLSYHRGEDFEFKDGLIRLKDRTEYAAGGGAFARGHFWSALGVNTEGDLLYSNSGYALGMVFVLPIIGAGNTKIVYRRH